MGHSPDQILNQGLTEAAEFTTPEALPLPVAFVFPGQGSQSLGMLSQWANDPIVRQTFDEASEALGYNVWELAQNGPEEKLNQTEFTQPALLTASVALYRLWHSIRKEKPSCLAGHSLGEYSALVCAEALNLADAVNLVAERGRLMQRAVPQGVGAMAAIIGLTDAQVTQACQQAKTSAESQPNWVVAPANFNSPQQVVIAGLKEAVDSVMAHAKALGAKRVIPLAVSVPSHCALMMEAGIALSKTLAALPIQLPRIPVYHNVDVAAHDSIDGLKQALVSQLSSPVRWVESIQKMAAEGVKTIVECGPGTVLTGLNKRIAPELRNVSIVERGVVCS